MNTLEMPSVLVYSLLLSVDDYWGKMMLDVATIRNVRNSPENFRLLQF